MLIVTRVVFVDYLVMTLGFVAITVAGYRLERIEKSIAVHSCNVYSFIVRGCFNKKALLEINAPWKNRKQGEDDSKAEFPSHNVSH